MSQPEYVYSNSKVLATLVLLVESLLSDSCSKSPTMDIYFPLGFIPLLVPELSATCVLAPVAFSSDVDGPPGLWGQHHHGHQLTPSALQLTQLLPNETALGPRNDLLSRLHLTYVAYLCMPALCVCTFIQMLKNNQLIILKREVDVCMHWFLTF